MKPGVYAHWKGNMYRYLFDCVLDDSVTGKREPAVAYVPLYGDTEITVCTLERFNQELCSRNGYTGKRFFWVSP